MYKQSFASPCKIFELIEEGLPWSPKLKSLEVY